MRPSRRARLPMSSRRPSTPRWPRRRRRTEPAPDRASSSSWSTTTAPRRRTSPSTRWPGSNGWATGPPRRRTTPRGPAAATSGGPTSTWPRALDLAVSLGGDGTMLRTVALVAGADVPVIGVNLGQLGYLTEVEPDGLRPALERFLAGDFAVEERMLLDVEIHRRGADTRRMLALNEAVLEKTASGHTVRLEVELDARVLHHLRGRRAHRGHADRLDRLRVLGAGSDRRADAPGAAAHPGVAAHALRPDAGPRRCGSDRASRSPGDRPAALVVDGRGVDVAPRGDRVVCRVADHRRTARRSSGPATSTASSRPSSASSDR